MLDDDAFVRAIEAAPADDAPRLVYADWLDEHGDPRAAFLRAEVRLAILSRLPSDNGAMESLRSELRELRTQIDANSWPRLARASNAARHVFRCSECRLPLTGPLWALADPFWIDQSDGNPLVPVGFTWLVDGDEWTSVKDHYCVNLADVLNTVPHRDDRRRHGCCGMDGCDGVNLMCSNRHEVGTECSDCWMPHFLHFEPTKVIKDDVEAGE